jgi:hypothetical protein
MQDREEATLELSLFAEAFQEMLARDCGERILQALYAERCACARAAAVLAASLLASLSTSSGAEPQEEALAASLLTSPPPLRRRATAGLFDQEKIC